jgi:hypothetical protein
MTVVQARETAVLGGAAKAVKSTEGYVFLVGHSTGRSREPATGARHQLLEIVLPQRLRGGLVARLEPVYPQGD